MFDPAADDYFTYAFSLTWTDPSPLDQAALTKVLRVYYDGLMAAVGEGRRKPPVAVELDAAGATGLVRLNDAFTNGAAIEVSLRLSGSECLIVHATARPTDQNWSALTKANECLCSRNPAG